MTDRDNYQRVGVEVDEQSFAKLTQRTNDTANSMSRLTQVNQSIADSAGQAGSRLQQAFANVQANVDNDTRSLQQLRAQLMGAAGDADNLGKKVNSGGDEFSGFSGLRRGGAALNRVGLGAIGAPVQALGDLQQISNLFDQFGERIQKVVPVLAAVDSGFLGMATVLAPLAVLVGAVAIGVKLYNDKLADSAKALDNARVALDTYYKAIQGGTTESTQKQLDALKAQKANIDAEVANIQTALNKGFESAKQQFGGDLGGRLATAGISATNEEFRKLGDRLNELKKQSGDLDGQIIGLGTAMGSAAVKANDLAEATLKNADLTAKSQIEQYKLIREGTSKQIQGIIDDNKDRLQVITQELAILNAIEKPTQSVKDRISELNVEFNTLSNQSAALAQNVVPLVKAREAEAEALKKLNDEVQQAQKLRDEQAQKEVDIVKKYNDAVQAAEDSAAQARIAAVDKLNDALVAAAQKMVDDANKALEQLNQKRADNLLSLERDEDKATRDANDKLYESQIKAQRQERDDLQAHLQRLKDIRDQDKSRERDDLLNRNYRDLFALGEQKKEQISAENDKFTAQEQQRKQAFQDEQNDEARAIAVQRRERLIAYNQANADALKQYNIELAHAQEAKTRAIQIAQQSYQKELSLISRGETDKLKLLRDSAISELKLITQTEEAKRKIFQETLNQARELLGQPAYTPAYNSPAAISAPTPNAEGGVNPAYKPIKVNDRYGGQRESANGVLLPRGLGLFIPMSNTSINPGSGGGNTSQVYNNTFNIVSHDPAGVRQEVIKIWKQVGPRGR